MKELMINKGKIIFCVLAFSLLTCLSVAQENIEVSAFYTDAFRQPMAKIDTTWTYNPIQVKIRHFIPSSKKETQYKFQHRHFTEQIVSDVFFRNVGLKVNDSLFAFKGTEQLINEINKHWMYEKEIFYSYNSAWAVPLGYTYFPQVFYAMSDTHSWCATNQLDNDSIQITFNVDSSLFYLRCSVHTQKNRNRFTTGLCTKGIPSFFLFYSPAYIHHNIAHKGRILDLLSENVDSNRSKSYDIFYQDTSNRQDLSLKRFLKVIDLFDREYPYSCAPDSIYIVSSNQKCSFVMGTDTIKYVFNRAFRDKNYALLLMDSKDFNSHTLLHELLHIYFPGFPKNENNLYQHYIFAESLVEYIAAYWSEREFSDTVFVKKKNKMLQKKQSIDKVKNLITPLMENEIEFGENGEDKTWIYYDFVPCRLHDYASKAGKENKFVHTVATYLLSLNKNREPNFDDFVSYLKGNDFCNIREIFMLNRNE